MLHDNLESCIVKGTFGKSTRTVEKRHAQIGEDVRGSEKAGGSSLWVSLSMVGGVLVAMFLVVARLGADQAARGERVLGSLDPIVRWVSSVGWQASLWGLANGTTVGWAVTTAGAVILVAGFLTGGRRAFPLLLLAAAASTATWGQIMLLADQPVVGVGFYAAGLACSVGLGVCCPLTRLRGIPQLPDTPETEAGTGPALFEPACLRRASWWWSLPSWGCFPACTR